jgi:ABC-type antimicrobial peptide transport system permease subunit
VVADAANDGPDHPVQPAVYLPSTRIMWMQTQFLVRTHGAPLSALRDVRLAIQSVNPDQQTARNVRDLEDLMEQEPAWRQQRLFSILFGAFSALALLLALLGLYSVISYSVAQRTNEFGIRMALGGQRRDVLKIVFVSAGSSVILGIIAGLGLSFALNRLIAQWVENASGSPLILLAASLLLLGVAALACLLPARRASTVDPMTALRSE